MRRTLTVTLALVFVVFVVARLRYAPPAPSPRTAGPTAFSAERARDVQAAIARGVTTRALGSEGNARGRAALKDALERAGLAVEEQTSTSCTNHGVCARVVNVIGVLPGTDPALPGVLLSAHHDSVPASPGASDDGVGSAVLAETARALASGPRPKRSVVALFTDGEENGLNGADAFVHGHPLARKLRFTVNVDARGSRGPSQMFETSRGNAGIVALLAAKLDRPVTSSIFYEVYKRLPNDTDFTVTKTVASGVNFANTAGIEHYHTSFDDIEHASLGTLQHHGDHVLAMARAFSAADDAARSDASADAVWFDVLAFGVVHWPASWTMLLALVALALTLGHAVRARVFDRGYASFLVVLALGAAPGVLLSQPIKRSLAASFVAHPSALVVAFDAAVLAGALGVGLAIARKASPRALWAGTWLGWATAGVALAHFAPGVSFLFVVPALVAALAGTFSPPIASAAPTVAASVLLAALDAQVYDALGFFLPFAVAAPTLLLATTMPPLLAGLPPVITPTRLAGALASVAAVALAVFSAQPAFSPEVPQRVNVIVRQDEQGPARAFVDASWGAASWGQPPPAMTSALGPITGRERALPWTLEAPFAELPPLGVPPPELVVIETKREGARKKLTLRARSPRGASAMALLFSSAKGMEIRVDGHFASPRPFGGAAGALSKHREGDGALLGLFGVPTEGLLVGIEIPDGPLEVRVFDRTFGVPAGPAAAAVLARKALGTAVASQDGDQTVATRTFTLE